MATYTQGGGVPIKSGTGYSTNGAAGNSLSNLMWTPNLIGENQNRTVSGPALPHRVMPKLTAPAATKPTAAKPSSPTKSSAKKSTGKQSALDKWLAGDTTYQQQLAEFNKSRSDYNTEYNRQRGITQRDYNTSMRALNLQGQQDRMDQQNDFAGRGILHSGVFAKSLADYNTDFNTRTNNLQTGENDKLGDLGSQRSQFLQELQLQMNAAKQDAIRRRAQQLGI